MERSEVDPDNVGQSGDPRAEEHVFLLHVDSTRERLNRLRDELLSQIRKTNDAVTALESDSCAALEHMIQAIS